MSLSEHLPKHRPELLLKAPLASLALLLALAGCVSPPPAPAPVLMAQPAPPVQLTAETARDTARDVAAGVAKDAAKDAAKGAAQDAVRDLLAYVDDLRARPGGLDLAAEVARQEAASAQPGADALVRARLTLVRMLAARAAEQQRLETLVEKQTQQLRDQSRRIDQLSERLEAMRAVERSLPARPALPAEAPASSAKP